MVLCCGFSSKMMDCVENGGTNELGQDCVQVLSSLVICKKAEIALAASHSFS